MEGRINVLAILQARASSSRLPGKVLATILGQPMLARQIERLRRAHSIDRLVVATSGDGSDDALATLCTELGVACYRGSLNDVLARFHGAYGAYGPAQNVVRLTGDCPLIDPAIVDLVIGAHLTSGADCTTNAIQATWPDGQDVEVLRASALLRAFAEARLASEREHVTPYIYNHSEAFRIEHVKGARDLSALRWTVDEPLDLAMVREIYAALYPTNPEFGLDDILALLARRPELSDINSNFRRNEGYALSVANDSIPEV
jgi:spore coat polysaccharide biosynthesis protein SpsF